jgi:negative regulator of sigma E activity
MNRDLALKYQALVDGELPEREARQLEQTLQSDPEAQAVVAELRATRALLQENEPEMTLPESREFYWSRIQRQIEQLQTEPMIVESGWLAVVRGWRRLLAPVAGVAVIAFLAIAALRFYNNPRPDDFSQHLAEIENLSEFTSASTFRSANMFVVWVHDTSSLTEAEAQPELIDNDDISLQ